jgi:hypothetical protein
VAALRRDLGLGGHPRACEALPATGVGEVVRAGQVERAPGAPVDGDLGAGADHAGSGHRGEQLLDRQRGGHDGGVTGLGDERAGDVQVRRRIQQRHRGVPLGAAAAVAVHGDTGRVRSPLGDPGEHRRQQPSEAGVQLRVGVAVDRHET